MAGTSGQTKIPFGSPLARKVYGAAVFAEVTRSKVFTNNLTGPAPKEAELKSKLSEKVQSHPGYPITRVTDLNQGAGDTVSVDLWNILEGKPVMGDRKLSGRMMSLASSSMDIKLDQIRGGVDTGGRMAQQRTIHNLRTIGRAGLAAWYARYADQVKLVHLAGARGSEDTRDWVIPLDSDPEFANIMVNSTVAPTYNRRILPGDATGVADLEATDIIDLPFIDRLRVWLDEQEVQMNPIKLPDDPMADVDPVWLLLLSPRQFHILMTRTAGHNIRDFQKHALQRGSKNPLFMGESFLFNGILVRKMPKAIRFFSGDTVKEATSAASFTTADGTVSNFGEASAAASKTAGHAIDRALLLGAQALGEVYGRHHASGTHFSWHEEETDHGNTLEASVSAMGGFSKLRFETRDGEHFDHGVAVVDSYAPDPHKITV